MLVFFRYIYKCVFIFILCFLFQGVFTVRAASYTWSGASSTAWGTMTNWSPSGFPNVTGDTFSITAGTGNPIITTSVAPDSGNIGAGKSLQIGNAGTVGSLGTSTAVTVTGSGSLIFNRTNLVSQGTDFGSIGGTGTLNKQGSGELVLTGNTYTGLTTISAGTITVSGAASTSGLTYSGGTNNTVNLLSANALGGGQITFANTTPKLNVRIDGGGPIAMANGNVSTGSGVIATIDVNNNTTGTNGTVTFPQYTVGNSTLNFTGGNGYSVVINSVFMTAGTAGGGILPSIQQPHR